MVDRRSIGPAIPTTHFTDKTWLETITPRFHCPVYAMLFKRLITVVILVRKREVGKCAKLPGCRRVGLCVHCAHAPLLRRRDLAISDLSGADLADGIVFEISTLSVEDESLAIFECDQGYRIL